MSLDYFSSHSKKLSFSRSFKLWFVIFIAGVFTLWYSGNILYQYSFGYLTGKVGKFFSSIKRDFPSRLNRDSSNNELNELKASNAKLAQENARLKEELRRNSVKFSPGAAFSAYNFVEAPVIGNDNFFDTPLLMIEGGRNKGVEKGMAVLDENGVLVGLIGKSEERFSEVKLLSNHASKVGAKIAGTSWNGVLEGSRNLRGVLTMLPLESEISEGVEVVTDNRNPAIPPDILIGSVAFARESEDKLFKEAVLNLFSDSKKLSKIWIITSRK
ncbi:MAG: rod shape-determining protein MreC [Candidatus Moranbacteria bacterium]|nr:rod shape-determining protein MreC [Candidatus Moranbacteria bacterium]